jgi:hypothetical protein
MTNNLLIALADTRQMDIVRQASHPSRHRPPAPRRDRPTHRVVSTLLAVRSGA